MLEILKDALGFFERRRNRGTYLELAQLSGLELEVQGIGVNLDPPLSLMQGRVVRPERFSSAHVSISWIEKSAEDFERLQGIKQGIVSFDVPRDSEPWRISVQLNLNREFLKEHVMVQAQFGHVPSIRKIELKFAPIRLARGLECFGAHRTVETVTLSMADHCEVEVEEKLAPQLIQ